ncbi:hypothetical protein ABW21_db0207658 [Orbilia brochopaga]|nr:hypothetical protein ABW21_db0207658 [Drechslerella brochopaga]
MPPIRTGKGTAVAKMSQKEIQRREQREIAKQLFKELDSLATYMLQALEHTATASSPAKSHNGDNAEEVPKQLADYDLDPPTSESSSNSGDDELRTEEDVQALLLEMLSASDKVESTLSKILCFYH